MVIHPFEILGQNIKQERTHQNMTQEQLSEKVGISAVFLSQIENHRKVPSLETVYKIASSLGITMEKIFKGDYISVPNVDQRIEVLLRGKSEKDKQELFDIMSYIAHRQNIEAKSSDSQSDTKMSFFIAPNGSVWESEQAWLSHTQEQNAIAPSSEPQTLEDEFFQAPDGSFWGSEKDWLDFQKTQHED